MADELGIAPLGKLPLVPALREGGDDGRPITAVDPTSEAAQTFREIARRIAVELKPRKIFSPGLTISRRIEERSAGTAIAPHEHIDIHLERCRRDVVPALRRGAPPVRGHLEQA